MDRKGEGTGNNGNRWAWLPAQMPGVARLIAEKRRQFGDAHVNACWRLSVVELQPGYFFAREGALAVGAPALDDPDMAAFAALKVTGTEAFLFMRTPPLPAPASTGV